VWFSPIFERFVEKSPVTVIVRGLMEVVLAPSKLDELFEQIGVVSYEGKSCRCRRVVVQKEAPDAGWRDRNRLVDQFTRKGCSFCFGSTIVSKTLAGGNFISGSDREFSL
jgi:hypothetical protein